MPIDTFDGSHTDQAEKVAAIGFGLLQRGHKSLIGNAADTLREKGIAGTKGFAQPNHAFQAWYRSGKLAGSPSLEYPVRLHESPDTYLELIQATADHDQIPAVYVEKDYWITLVLKRLQESVYC